MRFTKNTFYKIQKLFREQGYSIRYEKGNFLYGYCLVQQRKVVIINKFFDAEARMNCLLDIMTEIQWKEGLFSEESLNLYREVKHSSEKATLPA